MVERETEQDEKIHLDRTDYFFRKTYFVLNNDIYVEMVALASESYKVDDNVTNLKCDVIRTFSKELLIESLPEKFKKELLEKQTIKEDYQITEEQLDKLCKLDIDDLFTVEEDSLTLLK